MSGCARFLGSSVPPPTSPFAPLWFAALALVPAASVSVRLFLETQFWALPLVSLVASLAPTHPVARCLLQCRHLLTPLRLPISCICLFLSVAVLHSPSLDAASESPRSTSLLSSCLEHGCKTLGHTLGAVSLGTVGALCPLFGGSAPPPLPRRKKSSLCWFPPLYLSLAVRCLLADIRHASRARGSSQIRDNANLLRGLEWP